MVALARGILLIMVEEHGRKVLLRRLADPWWFQSLSCVLGYDWHSSGTTTVTCAALKEALLAENIGIHIAGGKGATARKTPQEIENCGHKLSLSSQRIASLTYASKICAKVDNAVLQDGYVLYHHAFVMSEEGDWAVIQQGMNTALRYARRYHLFGEDIKSFVNEPHNAIICDMKMRKTLNMCAARSQEARKASLDIASERPHKIRQYLLKIKQPYQTTIDEWARDQKNEACLLDNAIPSELLMPLRVNWKALEKVYEFQPRNYEELIMVQGIGPATIRALAYISALIFGSEPDWHDPVKYSFAFGGKDGVPRPVDCATMDEAIDILRTGIQEAKIGKKDKIEAIRRLNALMPKT